MLPIAEGTAGELGLGGVRSMASDRNKEKEKTILLVAVFFNSFLSKVGSLARKLF